MLLIFGIFNFFVAYLFFLIVGPIFLDPIVEAFGKKYGWFNVLRARSWIFNSIIEFIVFVTPITIYHCLTAYLFLGREWYTYFNISNCKLLDIVINPSGKMIDAYERITGINLAVLIFIWGFALFIFFIISDEKETEKRKELAAIHLNKKNVQGDEEMANYGRGGMPRAYTPKVPQNFDLGYIYGQLEKISGDRGAVSSYFTSLAVRFKAEAQVKIILKIKEVYDAIADTTRSKADIIRAQTELEDAYTKLQISKSIELKYFDYKAEKLKRIHEVEKQKTAIIEEKQKQANLRQDREEEKKSKRPMSDAERRKMYEETIRREAEDGRTVHTTQDEMLAKAKEDHHRNMEKILNDSTLDNNEKLKRMTAESARSMKICDEIMGMDPRRRRR